MGPPVLTCFARCQADDNRPAQDEGASPQSFFFQPQAQEPCQMNLLREE